MKSFSCLHLLLLPVLLDLRLDSAADQFDHRVNSLVSYLSSHSPSSNDSISTAEAIFKISETLSEYGHLQLHLIYDDHNREVISNLTYFPESLNGTSMIILSYEKAKEYLRLALTSSKGETIIVLLCSPENILEIFQLINSQNLLSTNAIWLLVFKNSQDENLFIQNSGSLIEGTRVVLLTRTSSNDITISVSKVDLEGVVRFNRRQMTDINNFDDLRIRRYLFRLLETENKVLHYSNMKGRLLKVASNGVILFTELGIVSEDGTISRYSGTEFSLLVLLSQKLNFTIRVVKSIDNTWGDLHADGTATGMIGMVYRREVDLALAHISIRRSRAKAVEFTVPFYQESMGILSRAPAVKNPTFIVFSPFTLEVWACLVLAVLTIGPFLKILSKASETSFNQESLGTLKDISFTIFRIFMIQGNRLPVRSWSHRTILYSWYIFCLIVIALYSGTLVAMLAIPTYEKPIDSLTDLPRAVSEGFTIGTLRQTIMEYIFRDAKDGIYKDTWLLFNHKDLSKSLLRGREGFNLVTETKYAYIFSKSVLETEVILRGKSRYHISRDAIYSMWIAMACTRGAPFKDIFDQLILRMLEGGLVNKWKKDEFRKLKKAKINYSNSGHQAIKIIHLQAAFYVLVLGSSLSITTFGMEKIYSRIHG